MTRRTALSTLAAPAFLQGQSKKRNLVFILSDDHRFDAMSAAGHPWLKTPNLDRVLNKGVHLRNAFVTTALCSPSRASVLTGQYGHSHGVLDNITALPQTLPTFPRELQKQGYRTALIGKWHMGGDTDDPQPGFDHWASFRGQGRYYDPVINFNGQRREVKGYVADILTEEALKFIRGNQSQPFLLYLGHKNVHAEFYPAQRHLDLYSKEPIPYPATYADTDETYRGKPAWVQRQRSSWHGVDGMYNKTVNFEKFYRDYMRCIQSLDDSVGAVWNELEERNLLNDTLFVYMGDNGFQFGEFGLIDKRTMCETSMRVPMMAHCPDLFDGGRKVDGMALGMDICPTMLEAAGAPIPSTVQSRSLLPLLQSKTTPADWRKEFVYEYFWERDFPQTPTVIGLRTDQYAWMEYHGTWDLDELYDIQKDPDQRNNLLAGARTTTEAGRLLNRIQNPDLKKLVTDLRDRRNKILRDTGGLPEPKWRM
jgi:N-acetylglucosamine-6-sulfatase